MFGGHSSGSFKAVKLWATNAIEIIRPGVSGLENATFVNTSVSHNHLDATAEDKTPHTRTRGVSLRTPKPAPNNVTREAAVADRACAELPETTCS